MIFKAPWFDIIFMKLTLQLLWAPIEVAPGLCFVVAHVCTSIASLPNTSMTLRVISS